VNKRFRVCDLNQPFLLPPSLQEWVPEDHLARFVADVCSELDLSAIYAEYERSRVPHPFAEAGYLFFSFRERVGDRISCTERLIHIAVFTAWKSGASEDRRLIISHPFVSEEKHLSSQKDGAPGAKGRAPWSRRLK
jgi:hypothetical protein